MKFRVLGPRDAFFTAWPALLTSPLQTRLLTALLISPGLQGPHSQLQNLAWLGEPPSNAAFRTCLKQLRKALPDVEVTSHDQVCSLKVPRDRVDLAHLRDVVADRQSPPDSADLARRLRDVLRLCDDGGALRHLPADLFRKERSRLDDERHRAWLACLRAELATNDVPAVLDDTERLLALWPGDQDLFGLRVEALASCRRTSEVRQEIAEWTARHGTPGAQLRATINYYAREQPAGRRPDGRGSRPRVPRQLPPTGRPITGRGAELREMRSLLTGGQKHRRRIVLLSGLPGVGKTALLLRIAARCESRFPGGTLYQDLHGYTVGRAEGADPEDVLAGFLDALGVEPVPATLNGKICAYRSALAERSVLVVLDNARNSEQLIPLLPGSGTSATIVTSRNALRGVCDGEEAHSMRITPLDRADAAALLHQAVSREHGAGNPRLAEQLVHELVDLCDRLPLALTIVAGRIRNRPLADLRILVGELRDGRAALDALTSSDGEQVSVRLAFDCSYRHLSEPAALLLRQLAVHPGPSIGWHALLDLGPAAGIADPGRAADELTAASLLERTAERLTLHGLIRIYARELTPPLGEAVRARTVRRICDHMLHQVWACDRVLVRGRHLPVADRPDIRTDTPGSEKAAMLCLDSEYETARAVLELAREAGDVRTVWLLSMALVTYQWRRSRYEEAARNLTDVLATSQDITNAGERAMVHRMLAGCYWNQDRDRLPVAAAHLGHAIALSERQSSAEDRMSLALSLNMLAGVRRKQGLPDEAREQFVRALAVFRELDDPLGAGSALNGMARLALDRGDRAEALAHATAAQDSFVTTTDRSSQANVFVTIGDVHAAGGDLRPAAAAYAAAVKLYRSLDYWPREARTLRLLGRVQLRSGSLAEVRQSLRRARNLEGRIQDHDTVQQDRPASR
ncbi:ATP-binding protein [Streptomyces sp. NPDC051567]|uniref:ATP-binding protein n=1 Tax=Streptomyces sp. NPDC051567 TaxID=3365660 RepID=UPI0037BE08AB